MIRRREARPGQRVRTPTRLQMEASECGATCLAIVVEHFGSYLPLAKVRQDCGVSRDGSKASNVLRAARAYGCDARGFRKEPSELRELMMPVILHWELNHFVVLEGFGNNGRVFINDPAYGPRTVTHEELDRAFTGVVLVVWPDAAFAAVGRRPALLPKLLQRLRGSYAGLSYVLLAGVALVVPGVLIPAFSKIFVDEILIGGKSGWLPGLLWGMGLTAALRAVLTWCQQSHAIKLTMKLGVAMSSRFLWHTLRLPVGFFYARSAGDLANRVQINDVVAGTLSQELSSGVLDLLLVGFYAVMMLYYDAPLTAIGLGTAALHLLLLKLAQRARTDLSRLVAHETGELAGVTCSGLQMIETLKASGAEADFFGNWAGHQAKQLEAQQQLLRREHWIRAIVETLSRMNALLVLGFGALRVIDGHLTLGGLVAFQSLMVSFTTPIERLAQLGATLQRLRGQVERLDDVESHPAEASPLPRPESRQSEAPATLHGELELRDLTFGYLPFSSPILNGINLHLAPGQRVALVGGTGSGKSTIAKLVAGLYTPWKGCVLFDGRVREAVPRSVVTAPVGVVDQEISLFAGSIRDNLTLWDDTVPEHEVIQAAKDACIHDDISKLPGGYAASLTEGGHNLSGGQRQRLELARALLQQPALLILDEATSALDSETERRVDENLRRRGCSCLIVAHRLSTIRDSDEILVLDAGRVVQRGSHEQLMEQGGLYRELIDAAA